MSGSADSGVKAGNGNPDVRAAVPGEDSLSTSALAKRLKLPIQQLFATLRDYGWIDRRGRGWALTAKGELHGGRYRDSERYGRYIVWPVALADHPMIRAIESNQRTTPGAMRRYFSPLTTLQINQSLCELGLQRVSARGYELTALGRRFGGRLEKDNHSGLHSVSWPHEIVDDPVLHRELGRRQADGHVPMQQEPHSDDQDGHEAHEHGRNGQAAQQPLPASGATPDLFAPGARRGGDPELRRALDGHEVSTLLQLRVCDWLYGAGLAHALHRALPVEEPLSADFYVPAAGLYIECWEREVPTRDLSRRLRTREVCREMELPYLEVAADDMERLDDLLSAKLRALGVDC
jgi:hypothetical protein